VSLSTPPVVLTPHPADADSTTGTTGVAITSADGSTPAR
jgi:hypothetical protein